MSVSERFLLLLKVPMLLKRWHQSLSPRPALRPSSCCAAFLPVDSTSGDSVSRDLTTAFIPLTSTLPASSTVARCLVLQVKNITTLFSTKLNNFDVKNKPWKTCFSWKYMICYCLHLKNTHLQELFLKENMLLEVLNSTRRVCF